MVRENVSLGHMRTTQARSDCASAQSDLGLHCPLVDSIDTVEYIYVYSKYPYQIVLLHWLVWSSTVHICRKVPFSHCVAYILFGFHNFYQLELVSKMFYIISSEYLFKVMSG